MTKHLIALAAAAIVLQGCVTPPTQAQLAAEDYNEGIATSCSATPADLSASATASATITMTNDGWCAVRTAEKDGQPFQLGLVHARPEHGHVIIQKAGPQTRIEYTADNRYVGADRFTVALRSRTANVPDATVQVTVNVTMGENTAPAATAPATRPATSTRSTTPARRATTPATHP